MGKVVAFRITVKHVERLARREVQKMYAVTGGGRDPIVDIASQELFEQGYLDEPRIIDWATYCKYVICRMSEE